MVCRMELRGDLPLYTIACHFPISTDTQGIKTLVKEYGELGHVVLMGDFNAHSKANGEKLEDTAGRRMEKHLQQLGLSMVNKMAVCEGRFSRIQERSDGTRSESTIDYVCVSQSLVSRVIDMILGERLGSDHRLLTLRLSNTSVQEDQSNTLREMWKTETLPVGEDPDFISAYQESMTLWMQQAGTQIPALEAAGVDARRISDILEWSFQAKWDETSAKQVGTKFVGPKTTPMLNKAMRLLEQHRKMCENALKKVVADKYQRGKVQSSSTL